MTYVNNANVVSSKVIASTCYGLDLRDTIASDDQTQHEDGSHFIAVLPSALLPNTSAAVTP